MHAAWKIFAAAIFLILGIAALAAPWWIDFESMHQFLRQFSSNGKAESLTSENFPRILSALRLMVIVASVAALALIWKWRAFHRLTQIFFSFAGREAPAFFRQWQAGLRQLERADWALIATLTVLGAFLRWHHLMKPIIHDEAYSFLVFVPRRILGIFSQYTVPNNHILNTLWMKFCAFLFGPSEPSLRASALAAGLLTIGATYFYLSLLLRNKFYRAVGALMVAQCAALIEFSTLARGYSLQALLGMLALISGHFLLERQNRFTALAMGFLCALGFLCVPTMLFPFAVFCLYWAIAALQLGRREPARLRELAICGSLFLGCSIALTALGYLPAALFSSLQSIVGNRFVVPLAMPEFLAGLPLQFASLAEMPFRQQGGFFTALMAGVFCANFLFPRRLAAAFAFSLLTGVMAVLFYTRTAPPLRVFAPLLPLYIVAVVTGLAALETFLSARLPAIATSPGRKLAGTALVIALAFGAARTRTDVQQPSELFPESSTLFSSETMFRIIAADKRPDISVVVPFPNVAMIDYQFAKHKVILPLNEPTQNPKIVYVIRSDIWPSIPEDYTKPIPQLHSAPHKTLVFGNGYEHLWEYRWP